MSQTIRRVGLLVLALAGADACVTREEAPPAPTPAPVSLPPEPARAALTINADVPYALFVPAGAKCVLFAGGNDTDHARAVIAPCDGSKAQQFKVTPVSGGYHTFVNVQSNKCLDVEALSLGEGAHVQQFTCNGGPNQQWILADGGVGTLRLVARHSGKVMDIEGGVVVNGAPVNQFSWHSADNQRFKLVEPAASVEAGGKGEQGQGGASGAAAGGKVKAKAGKGKRKAAPEPVPPS